MSFLHPAVADRRALTSRGQLVHAGRSLALSEATVADADGRDLAHCTSLLHLLRTRTCGPSPASRCRHRSGAKWAAEIMRGLIDGSLPSPPIHHLTGQRPIAAEGKLACFAIGSQMILSGPLAGGLEPSLPPPASR
jgi:hypothetical protein